ncbi:MAG: protein-disulfide isomerase [Myxococcota bacterium]|jgi:protein-disulfide isomerase
MFRIGMVEMGRCALIAAALMLVTTGCDSKKAPVPAATAPAIKPAEAKPAEAKPAEAKPPVAKPAVAKPPVVKPAAVKPMAATPAKLTQDEMRELERRPGASEPLEGWALAAGPKAAALPGQPGSSPAAGTRDPIVEVYVLSDFQCPVCRRAAEPVKFLAREFAADVRVVFLHNALTMHRRAEPAAIASLAAHRQGKFWVFYDNAFRDRRLEDADLETYAQQSGLDMERYKKDIADPTLAAQVAYERAFSEALDARGTPAFIVNGKKSVGWGSYAGLRGQVKRAVEAAKAEVAAGTARDQVAAKLTRASGPDGVKLLSLLAGE